MLSTTQHQVRFASLQHLALMAFATSSFWTSALAAADFVSTPPASASQTQRTLVDLFRKRPYLIFPGDPTKMQVLWQLTATDNATIQWGVDQTYSGGSAQTVEYGVDHQHTVTISGLTPGQHYVYRVTVQDASYTGSFNAAPAPAATRVKFLAYGDTRSNPSTHDQVAAGMIAAWNVDPAFQSFALNVGDLVADGESEADWTDEFFDPTYENIQQFLAQIPYQACMGNHEGDGELFVKYFPYPFTGARYWSFDYGPAHVVVVDQYTSYSPGSSQLLWIESDLAATTKPWKFLVLHEPGWSAGGGHGNVSEVQDDLQPLCVQYGVSIVFGGHNHYYAHAVVDDVHHITTGGGGAPLYTPNPNAANIVASASANHFTTIDIDGRRLHFRALRSDGALIDSFSVRLPPTPVTLSDITATAGSDYVDLRWSAFLDGPASLQVLRSTHADGSYTPVSELLPGTPGRRDFAWRDIAVHVATEYYYRIGWRETAEWHYSGTVRVVTATASFGIRHITPNPLGSGTTRIEFELAHAGWARLDIFDAAGQRLCTLVNSDLGPGTRTVPWDGRDQNGRPLPAGVYFAKLSSNGAEAMHKIVLAQ